MKKLIIGLLFWASSNTVLASDCDYTVIRISNSLATGAMITEGVLDSISYTPSAGRYSVTLRFLSGKIRYFTSAGPMNGGLLRCASFIPMFNGVSSVDLNQDPIKKFISIMEFAIQNKLRVFMRLDPVSPGSSVFQYKSELGVYGLESNMSP